MMVQLLEKPDTTIELHEKGKLLAFCFVTIKRQVRSKGRKRWINKYKESELIDEWMEDTFDPFLDTTPKGTQVDLSVLNDYECIYWATFCTKGTIAETSRYLKVPFSTVKWQIDKIKRKLKIDSNK